jgi:hypothetical protein
MAREISFGLPFGKWGKLANQEREQGTGNREQ